MRTALKRIAFLFLGISLGIYVVAYVLFIPFFILLCLIWHGLKYLARESEDTGYRLDNGIPLETRHRMIILTAVVCGVLPVALVIVMLAK